LLDVTHNETQSPEAKKRRGETMKSMMLLSAAIFTVAIFLPPRAAVAQGNTRVTGGGTGTFGADLDSDGDIDGSQFGMGVTIRADGSAQGHFLCLMAGRSDILGLHIMAVQGQVTDGSDNGDGSVSFSGSGTVNLGNGQIFTGVPFTVTVTAGDPEVGTLQLTVIGAFDDVPGDTVTGNGNYDLPIETVSSGRIEIH
jgi:hypothetical protein